MKLRPFDRRILGRLAAAEPLALPHVPGWREFENRGLIAITDAEGRLLARLTEEGRRVLAGAPGR